MVRSGVGVVRDARVSKPSFTSPTPQARRRAVRARLEAAAAPREAPCRNGATPLSQPRSSYAPIHALFRTRPTLLGEDRPSSASRASSGASLSSGGASPMLPPAPASQPARGRHRRPHALSLVVGAGFCVAYVDTRRWALSGLVAGRAGPSAGRGAEVQNRGGAASARSLSGRRAHGSVARLVPH